MKIIKNNTSQMILIFLIAIKILSTVFLFLCDWNFCSIFTIKFSMALAYSFHPKICLIILITVCFLWILTLILVLFRKKQVALFLFIMLNLSDIICSSLSIVNHFDNFKVAVIVFNVMIICLSISVSILCRKKCK